MTHHLMFLPSIPTETSRQPWEYPTDTGAGGSASNLTVERTRTAILFPLAVVCAALVGLWPAPAHSQEGRPGIRAGVSIDPDQFFFGGHVETAPLLEELRFRPNLEIGIGSNLTVVAVNLEFAYWFPLDGQPYSIYAGAGPAVNLYRFRRPVPGDRTSAEGGLNFLVGLAHEGGLFGELKIGALDSPEMKVTVGYVFR